jgi:hypothetical protein
METAHTDSLKINSRRQISERFIYGICLACVFLFVYAGYTKLMDHSRFYQGLSRVEFLSPYAALISWFVPLWELLIAVVIIIPRHYRKGLYAFLGTILLFTFYILGMLLWAAHLPCHCGGVIEKMSWGWHVWFNLVFIGLAALALGLSKSSNLKNQKNEKF